MDDENAEREKAESLSLKTLAEQKYNSSNLKSALKYAKKAHRLCPNLDGIAEMVTAFKILHVAAKISPPITGVDTTTIVPGNATTPHWYKILQVEPFSHINTIKKQYKKLALTLHPDKNSFIASEEAFKLVAEAFRVLSDKIRRKEYDMKLRVSMQEAAAAAAAESSTGTALGTFWTACSTCRLLHQFEKKYLGHNLMCPSCNKSFKAVEASDTDEKEKIQKRISARILMRSELKRKMGSVEEILERSGSKRIGSSKNANAHSNSRGEKSKAVNNKEERGIGVKVYENTKGKRVKTEEEMMTLAEMQMLAKRKVNDERLKLKLKEKEREKEKDWLKENNKSGVSRRGNSKIESNGESRNGDSKIMAVEDSDFYDFDKGRVERSFKKGQVWAIYDDDDGMPRDYGLIDEVVSTHPFEVKMSWLDLQSNGDVGLICSEEMGFHISCGRFRVSRRTSVKSLNVFSHIMDCERAAREVYRIYPKKGSVWALNNENAMDTEGRNALVRDKRCYDIVVFLTSYSEMHGLSMAYLEKVNGFKTVFKRREIGCHAIRWLEKDDVRSFSHQIPARKLSGEEASELSKDCWELDPASLPPELLTIGWGR